MPPDHSNPSTWAELKVPEKIKSDFAGSTHPLSETRFSGFLLPATMCAPKNSSKLGRPDLPPGQLGARTPRPRTFLWLGRPDLPRRAAQTPRDLAIIFSQLLLATGAPSAGI